MNTLPFELLSDVFQYCLSSEHNFYTPYHTYEYTRLRLVCKQWDHITITTPRLWTRLRLHLGIKINRWDASLFMIALWLDRSAPLPISLYITIPPPGDNYDENYMDPDGEIVYPEGDNLIHDRIPECLDVLWTSIDRWGSLTFVCFEIYQLQRLGLSLSNARCLRSLILTMECSNTLLESLGPSDKDEVSEVVMKRLGTAPSLQSLTVSVSIVAHCMSDWVSLHKLTRLKLECLAIYWPQDWFRIWDVCRACVSATQISLSIGRTEDAPAERNSCRMDPICLPQLEVLRLALWGDGGTPTPLPSLHCSSLKALHIEVWPRFYDRFLYQVVQCIAVPRSLHTLFVAGLGREELHEFFTHPTVTRIPSVLVHMNTGDLRFFQRVAQACQDRGRSIDVKRCGMGPDAVLGWVELHDVPRVVKEYLTTHGRTFRHLLGSAAFDDLVGHVDS